MPPELPIFVISLARAATRRENICARLDKAGLHYEVVDAIDGAQLDITPYIYRFNQRKFNRKFGRDMTPREVACYLSHYQLWERIAAAKNHCALVLEDDADWHEDLAAICEEIDSLPWPWGVVLLSARQSKVSGRVLEPHIGDNRRLILPDRRIATAAGYLISQWAARALLEHCREISAPLDIAYGEWWRSEVPFYVVSKRRAKRESPRALFCPARLAKTKRRGCWSIARVLFFRPCARVSECPLLKRCTSAKRCFVSPTPPCPKSAANTPFTGKTIPPQTMAELIQTTLAEEQTSNGKAQARMSWAAKFSRQDNAAAYVDIYRRLTKQ